MTILSIKETVEHSLGSHVKNSFLTILDKYYQDFMDGSKSVILFLLKSGTEVIKMKITYQKCIPSEAHHDFTVPLLIPCVGFDHQVSQTYKGPHLVDDAHLVIESLLRRKISRLVCG